MRFRELAGVEATTPARISATIGGLHRAILLVCVCSSFAWAQPQPAAPNPAAATPTASQGFLIDKLMGIVTPAEPSELTQKKRFHLYVLSVGGPVPLLAEAAGAGLSQWDNVPKEWGQGWNAYGKRYGDNLAYNGIRQTITYGTSMMFHEDNRYFASHKQGVLGAHRLHALRRTVTAQHPDGREVFFGFEQWLGVVGASAISTIWAPGSGKGVDQIAKNAGISFAATAAFNVVREFLPGILHHPQK